MKLLSWIRDSVPSLVEDEEYREPVQEPPTKKRRALGEEAQHHLAKEVSYNTSSVYVCICVCLPFLDNYLHIFVF